MAHFTENRFIFAINDKKVIVFAEMLDNIYIYIIGCARQRKCAVWHIFTFWRRKPMRIILDTDKKATSVP